MGYRDILVHVDGLEASVASRTRLDYAVALASDLDCHLTGLVLAIQPTIPPMIMGEVPGTLLELQRKAALDAAAAAREAFLETTRRAGIASEARLVECTEGLAPSALASQARVADLTIVGQAERDDLLAIRELLTESALFESGRPVLVVPHSGVTTPKYDRALVAWDGRREAARAVHDALPLLLRADKVEVVVAADHSPAADQDTPGADLALHLARHGLDVTAKTIGSRDVRVADAILSHATDYGADLLVMGGYGHSRLRQFIMGGATRGILSSMTVPTLLSH